jgi:hypothetical protein
MHEMSSEEDDSLEEIECDLLVERFGARVVVRRVMRKIYDALSDKQKGRFLGIMGRWCEDPRMLTPEMFNGNEGRSPRHNVLLQALKIRKVRLYGFSRSIGRRRTFIIVDADPAKKQDKADQNVLKRARGRVDDITDIVERS